MKYIQKKIVSELPKTVGSITDTLNVEDKSRNAPSINLVSQMAGVPTEGIIDYEGEEIPEGYEEVEGKSFITTGLSANYTASSTATIILPMKTVFSKYGNAFTVQGDGTILINKDMHIKIHAQIFFSAVTVANRNLILKLNDTEISYSVKENAQQYSIVPTHTGIINTKKGDVVKLTTYLSTNDVINSMQKNTFMTIEEMDEPRNIQRKSTVILPKTTGNIVDTLNVEDKITNAPSINLVQMMAGIPEEGIIEFDGDEIPEGYEEVEQKSIATFKTGNSHGAYTVSTAYSPLMVKLEKTSINKGNAFTLNSDGSLKINKNCFVKLSCNMMTSGNVNPIIGIRYKNNTSAQQLAEAYTNVTNTSAWVTLSISPLIIEFKEGDEIYVGVTAQSTGTVQVASYHFSWITLEEV